MRRAVLTLLIGLAGSPLAAAQSDASQTSYRLEPGDVLQVNVWKETDLQSEVIVRPDGRVAFPLAGEVLAATRTVEELRAALQDRLRKFVPDALVTVLVKSVSGNRVYVIGKVARPGDFVLSRPTDVMQALALAGGMTPFADPSGIKILRREGETQRAIEFRYGDAEQGRHLDRNILLQGGDTVVVP
jgi:polysaccharide export outer membrane protein